MRLCLHGNVGIAGSVAVVGTWDPFLTEHRRLAIHLRNVARRARLTGVAIILEPAPTSFTWPRREWPVYHALEARRAFLKSCGVLTTLVVRLRRDETEEGAAFFVRRVAKRIGLRLLLVGAKQSLGPASKGSHGAIRSACRNNKIRMSVFPTRARLARLQRQVRYLLAKGDLRRARSLVGSHPILANKQLRNSFWTAADYDAVLLRPLDTALESNLLRRIQLRSGRIYVNGRAKQLAPKALLAVLARRHR